MSKRWADIPGQTFGVYWFISTKLLLNFESLFAHQL
jgi:hypothetical protein